MVQEELSFKEKVYARTTDENRDHNSSQVFASGELNVNEYDQEISQSHIAADQSTLP